MPPGKRSVRQPVYEVEREFRLAHAGQALDTGGHTDRATGDEQLGHMLDVGFAPEESLDATSRQAYGREPATALIRALPVSSLRIAARTTSRMRSATVATP